MKCVIDVFSNTGVPDNSLKPFAKIHVIAIDLCQIDFNRIEFWELIMIIRTSLSPFKA